MHRGVLSLAVVALTATACGSSGGGTPAATSTPGSASVPIATAPVSLPPTSTAGASGPSVEHPCSFITADEMSQILGATATVQDDGFRCKYVVGDGWLQVELMEFASSSAAEIWDYDKAHGTPTPGVGDEAYIFGAAIVAKLGDVLVDVDGNNLPQPADDATLTTIATKIIEQIP